MGDFITDIEAILNGGIWDKCGSQPLYIVGKLSKEDIVDFGYRIDALADQTRMVTFDNTDIAEKQRGVVQAWSITKTERDNIETDILGIMQASNDVYRVIGISRSTHLDRYFTTVTIERLAVVSSWIYSYMAGGIEIKTPFTIYDNGNIVFAITSNTGTTTNNYVLIWDNANQCLKWASVFDANAIHDNVGGEINAITEKASPDDADLVVIEDSAAAYAKKKVQLSNFPGYYTDEKAQDAIGTILVDTTTIDFTYDDVTPEIKAAVKPTSIDNSHIAAAAAIAWSKISKTGSNLNEIVTRSHTVLSDIGTKTHPTIDNHIDNVSEDHTQYLLLNGTRAMTGNLDLNENDIKNVDSIDGGDAYTDSLYLKAYTASPNNFTTDGYIHVGSQIKFEGFADFDQQAGNGFALIEHLETVDCQGKAIIINVGFKNGATLEFDTAQSLSAAFAFQEVGIWKEIDVISGSHSIFEVGGFSSGPSYNLAHAGTGKPMSRLMGYCAEPKADGGPGTLTMPFVAGFSTNPPSAFKSLFGVKVFKNCTVTEYNHFEANSGNSNALILDNATITEEVAFNAISLNRGSNCITLKSDAAGAYMSHAGDIRIITDNKGLYLGVAQDAYLLFTGSALKIKANNVGANDYILLDSDVQVAAGKDLDCYTNAAYFKPRRVSQSAQPTPDAAELLLWHDTDDNKTYLVYNDPSQGVRSAELI